jgi:molecular chaperone HscB
MNYFELLAIEKTFDIDLAILEKNYLELQQQLHPDRFVNASPASRLAATQRVADINQGYETLKSFQKRAEYLLKLAGYEINEKELSKNVDKETLLESMQQREDLDSSTDIIEIENLTREVAGQKKELLARRSDLFSKEEYQPAFAQVIRLKYLDKFLTEAKNKLLKIGQENAA